jgi:hypothetical protein
MMNMANTSNLFPTMDMWGTKLVTLDVEVPRDTSLRMLFTNPGAFWYAKQHNFSNWLKNMFSMYTIAKARAFTGVDCDFRFSLIPTSHMASTGQRNFIFSNILASTNATHCNG